MFRTLKRGTLSEIGRQTLLVPTSGCSWSLPAGHTMKNIMCSVSATPMQVRGTGVYRESHLYSATPMVRIELDLGALED